MRQTIKTRSFLLVSALVIIAVVTSVWRAREYFRDDKTAFLEETSLRQVTTTERLVRERLGSLEKEVQIAIERRASIGTKSDLFLGLDDLLMVSSLEAPIGDAKAYKISWYEKNPGAAKLGSLSELDTALNQLAYMIDPAGEPVQIKRLTWQDGRPLFAMVSLADKKAQVAFLEENPLDRVVRPFKGSVTTSFIVDRDGIVIAHPMAAYLGVSFENHPVISEIRAQKKRFGTGTFEDLDGRKVFARYQAVEGAGLYAVLTSQTNEVFSAYYSLSGPFGILTVGILLIALAATFAFSSGFQDSVDRLKILASRIRSGDLLEEDELEEASRKTDEFDQVAGQLADISRRMEERERELAAKSHITAREERQTALQRMGLGLSGELKGPLAGILGHVQLLKEKAEGRDDLKKHIDFIERETRRSREVVEDIARYSGLDRVPFEALDFYDVVVASLEQVEHRISRMGVTLQKELQSAPTVMGLSHQIQNAIGSVLLFVGRRLETTESAPGGKRIQIRLEQEDRQARLTIEAEGLKLGDDEKERLFDPFFVPKADGKDTGLALSAAMGIVKAHDGQITMSPDGIRITISLPVSELRASRFQEQARLKDLDILEDGVQMTNRIPALPELPKIDFSIPPILVKKDIELPLPPGMTDIEDGGSIVRPPKMEI